MRCYAVNCWYGKRVVRLGWAAGASMQMLSRVRRSNARRLPMPGRPDPGGNRRRPPARSPCTRHRSCNPPYRPCRPRPHRTRPHRRVVGLRVAHQCSPPHAGPYALLESGRLRVAVWDTDPRVPHGPGRACRSHGRRRRRAWAAAGAGLCGLRRGFRAAGARRVEGREAAVGRMSVRWPNVMVWVRRVKGGCCGEGGVAAREGCAGMCGA